MNYEQLEPIIRFSMIIAIVFLGTKIGSQEKDFKQKLPIIILASTIIYILFSLAIKNSK